MEKSKTLFEQNAAPSLLPQPSAWGWVMGSKVSAESYPHWELQCAVVAKPRFGAKIVLVFCCCKFTFFVSKFGKRVELVLFLISFNLKFVFSLNVLITIDLRRGYTWRLIRRRLTRHFLNIWVIFQATLNLCLAVLCKFLGDFWEFWERDIFFFSKDIVNLRKIWNVELIWWIWKIEIWSEELEDGYQTFPLPTWGSHLGGQLSGSVSDPF